MADLSDEELLAALGEDIEPKKATTRTLKEERIIAGFEDVQRFVDEHGRSPVQDADRDIFERLYAVRLDRLRALAECRDLLAPLDHQGLLEGNPEADSSSVDALDDEALLAELGNDEGSDLTNLRHVRSNVEKRAAEAIASREKCEDFDLFRPLFEQVQADLGARRRETRTFERDTEITAGQFFILGGVKAYIASVEEEFLTPEGRLNRRMRVIWDNGTESRALMRSFQRSLYKEDNAGRRITELSAGPLFASTADDNDEASGTIYVLRSLSDLPKVEANRDLLHKIGVTSGKVGARIANAKNDATFLLAEVEIVRTYHLFNINRIKLEALIHRLFAPARLDIEIADRFGNPVTPREWFLVPDFVIDEAVERIRSGSIAGFLYDPASATLVRRR